MSKQLIRQLKSSAIGTPDSAWKSQAREVLCMQIRNTVSPRREGAFAYGVRPLTRMWVALSRPVVPYALAVAAFLGIASTLQASQQSIPGDTLYPVKRATESAQLSVVARPTDKVRVQANNVERRAQETALALSRGGDRAQDALTELTQSVDVVAGTLAQASSSPTVTTPDEIAQSALKLDDTLTQVKSGISALAPTTQTTPAVTDVITKIDTVRIDAIEKAASTPVTDTVTIATIEDRIARTITAQEARAKELLTPTPVADTVPTEVTLPSETLSDMKVINTTPAPIPKRRLVSLSLTSGTSVADALVLARQKLEQKDYAGAVDLLKQVNSVLATYPQDGSVSAQSGDAIPAIADLILALESAP